MPGKNRKHTLGSREPRFDLTLPSGETCEVRRPGIPGLIKAGVLDSFDQLTSLVQIEHIGPNTPRPTQQQVAVGAADLMKDPAKLQIGFEMIDRLVAYVVTQPPVWVDYKTQKETEEDFIARQEKAERDEAVAVSDVDDADKAYIMNFAVGGSADLTTFRQGLTKTMADMAGVQDVPLPAE